jgi:hypothetical protein
MVYCNKPFLQILWSDGRESWVKESNLPKAIVEIIKKGGSYEVKTSMVKEFGQKRSLLEIRTPEDHGADKARVMKR